MLRGSLVFDHTGTVKKELSGLSDPVFWSWWNLLGIRQACREMALPSAGAGGRGREVLIWFSQVLDWQLD